MPKISVLMPVYNGEKYLKEAIRSILAQTFSDFEFLIINDGSTDNSVKIIESFDDPRIRLIHNPENIGLAETCNRGLELASGEYIARMDCDDISLPERFFRQIAFMEANPEISISGTWAKIVGENEGHILKRPCEPSEAEASLLFNTCFIHPTVIMRRKAIIGSGIRYKKEFDPGDDYVFWTEMSETAKFANLPEVLLFYRMHPKNISKLKSVEQINGARQARLNLLRKLGLDPAEEELLVHSVIKKPDQLEIDGFLDKLEKWLVVLAGANEKTRRFNHDVFLRVLADRWFDVSYGNASSGPVVWKKYWQAVPILKKNRTDGSLQLIKFFIKCVIKK